MCNLNQGILRIMILEKLSSFVQVDMMACSGFFIFSVWFVQCMSAPCIMATTFFKTHFC
jgi:hypothetical protein